MSHWVDMYINKTPKTKIMKNNVETASTDVEAIVSGNKHNVWLQDYKDRFRA